jgi:hypothetical protein
MASAGGLLKFLEDHRITTPGESITHVTLTPPGKYFVGSDILQEFYDLYYDYVEVHTNKITLTESPQVLGPCKVDLDFQYEAGTTAHKHTPEQVLQFVLEYVKTMRTFLVVPDAVEVYVMEKKKPTPKKDGAAGGVHVLVPDVRTTKYVEMGIRDVMLTKMSMFDDVPLKEKEWSSINGPSGGTEPALKGGEGPAAVPDGELADAIDAAEECPGECIFFDEA